MVISASRVFNNILTLAILGGFGYLIYMRMIHGKRMGKTMKKILGGKK